jgi:hypothetical protein
MIGLLLNRLMKLKRKSLLRKPNRKKGDNLLEKINKTSSVGLELSLVWLKVLPWVLFTITSHWELHLVQFLELL